MLDSSEIAAQKARLRDEVHGHLAGFSSEWRALGSLAVASQVSALAEWEGAESILFYFPRTDEPDMTALIEQSHADGRRVLLPRYVQATGVYELACVKDLEKDLVPGMFGIMEPAPSCPAYIGHRVDFILAPGVAFDKHGVRLGRGKGFYDRLLAAVSGVRCGVAFDFQLYENLPAAAHDIRMQIVVCSGKVIRVPC